MEKNNILQKIKHFENYINYFLIEIKKEHPLLVSVLVGFIALLLWYIYNRNFEVLVQIFIFVAILWYSFETRTVKKAMVFQNELKQRPIIDLYLRDNKNEFDKKEWFVLRNIGKGVAYNIEVEPIILNEYEYQFYFEQVNHILAPLKDEKKLSMVTKIKDGIIMHGLENFKNEISKQKEERKFAVFLISYKNIKNKSFYSVFKFYNRLKLPIGNGEFFIEFIKNAEGNIKKEIAYEFCKNKQLKDSNFR